MPGSAFTIGTAGHIDHGKTTLVRRMTGVDTDRLEEERRRGISIDLGYAELELPSGRRASIVDVPGHERFVKNMVAGAAGIDAFLLVVAADDGVMPQTREHLDVIRMLGVRQGVVALTKTDAVDEETADIAELEVQELLEETGYEETPVVRVSGVTGAGVQELLRKLDRLAPEGRRQEGLVRLPVDRAFVLRGIGLVVTGTLWSGVIRPGDRLYALPQNRPVQVRGVQVHGRPVEAAAAGSRTALDLVGMEAGEIERGDMLASEPLQSSRRPDVRVNLLPGAPRLKSGSRVRVYHGTRATAGRLRLHGAQTLEPGGSARARLTLQDPLAALGGDRFVLRSMSPQVTIGGGTIIDPHPARRRPEPGWLEALEARDLAAAVPILLRREPERGLPAAGLARRLPADERAAERAARAAENVTELGGLYCLQETASATRGRLLAALERRAEENPVDPALSAAEARRACGVEPRLADAVVSELIASGQAERTEGGVALAGAGGPGEEVRAAAESLLERLRKRSIEFEKVEPGPAAQLLLKEGKAVRLNGSTLAAKEAADRVFEEIRRACEEKGSVTLAELRDRLNTSRKYAQGWLEFADAAGLTRRIGDERVLTRRYR
ncbi:selenocysteine-specific translation elongation factor [Rubrobacter taiwanensis]|jgi:selenocysteine-specific elongation factor|uniref:Selenocysteine-specific elongation factor n=1 Tax=Rubrobacter taiwanensis TaxID=185139 RepID=A0A4R1BRG9_9ACTN|nr:selenocysteine-specific translation elongation factor [Rubrobacter taiwanensis]TCJ19917.1 selenocysteine-specific translation elongation factor [Rubrobacter taiwanensis]